MTSVSHIRGDTFAITLRISAPDTITAIRSQIRTKQDALMSEAEVTETEDPGVYSLRVLDTTKWPAADKLFMDIEIQMGEIIRSTNIITIDVLKDITRG